MWRWFKLCMKYEVSVTIRFTSVNERKVVCWICFSCSQVPTMYVRLLQGYDAMDADSQKACSYAARQLRLMVITHLFTPILLSLCMIMWETSLWMESWWSANAWAVISADVRVISSAWTNHGKVGKCDWPSPAREIWHDRGVWRDIIFMRLILFFSGITCWWDHAVAVSA